MTTVLAIDTSTEIASVALLRDDVILAEIESADAARHDAVLLPRIDAALATAGLRLEAVDLLAVGLGPGAFGGLRVGLATIHGLAIATKIPTVGVCSLAALARHAASSARYVLPLVDAYRGEVYGALYEQHDGQWRERIAPFVATPTTAAERVRAACDSETPHVLGNGLAAHGVEIASALGVPAFSAEAVAASPRARHVASIARARYAQGSSDRLIDLLPIYVRDSDAKLPDRPLQISTE